MHAFASLQPFNPVQPQSCGVIKCNFVKEQTVSKSVCGELAQSFKHDGIDCIYLGLGFASVFANPISASANVEGTSGAQLQ